MQSLSLHRQEIDWHRLRGELRRMPAMHIRLESNTPARDSRIMAAASTNPATQLLRSKSRAGRCKVASKPCTDANSSPSPSPSAAPLSSRCSSQATGRYAYLVIPPRRGAHAEDLGPRRDHRWAEDLSTLTTKAAQQGAAGWILNPRRTSVGVHVLSMLAGLQPLRGNGKILTFQMSHARPTA